MINSKLISIISGCSHENIFSFIELLLLKEKYLEDFKLIEYKTKKMFYEKIDKNYIMNSKGLFILLEGLEFSSSQKIKILKELRKIEKEESSTTIEKFST
jgi:predicted transcriptional regulator